MLILCVFQVQGCTYTTLRVGASLNFGYMSLIASPKFQPCAQGNIRTALMKMAGGMSNIPGPFVNRKRRKIYSFVCGTIP